jgi:hypothetical protein
MFNHPAVQDTLYPTIQQTVNTPLMKQEPDIDKKTAKGLPSAA